MNSNNGNEVLLGVTRVRLRTPEILFSFIRFRDDFLNKSSGNGKDLRPGRVRTGGIKLVTKTGVHRLIGEQPVFGRGRRRVRIEPSVHFVFTQNIDERSSSGVFFLS